MIIIECTVCIWCNGKDKSEPNILAWPWCVMHEPGSPGPTRTYAQFPDQNGHMRTVCVQTVAMWNARSEISSCKTSRSETSVFKSSWCKRLRCEMSESGMFRVRVGNLEVRNVLVLWCPGPKWFMCERPALEHPDANSPGLKHLGARMSVSYPYSHICQFQSYLIHTTHNSTKTKLVPYTSSQPPSTKHNAYSPPTPIPHPSLTT